MNLKQYKQKLAGLVKSAKTIRDKVQDLIRVGLNHYAEHGDACYLTMLAEACVGVKALPTQTITDYIKAHANVKWVKPKGEQGRFMKSSKGEPAIAHELTVTWYDWAGATHNRVLPDVDADVLINRTIKSLERALKDGKAKNPDHAKEVLAKMKTLVTTTEAA